MNNSILDQDTLRISLYLLSHLNNARRRGEREKVVEFQKLLDEHSRLHGYDRHTWRPS